MNRAKIADVTPYGGKFDVKCLRSAAGMLVLANVLMAPAAWSQDGTGDAAAEPPAAEEAPPARPIDIFNYRIEGNSVLDRRSVEKAVLPYLGPQRSTADVEAARAALEQAYHAAGYETVAVEIPEQDVRDGIVRLNVTELRVGRLRVRNARWYSPEDIKDRAPALAEGQVPNYRAVQAQVAALNRSAERTITPSLRAGNTPGTVDIDLEVEDRLPLHGTFELNDRSSARTERLRASASIRYANLFQRDHSLSIQGQLSPEDPSQSWVVSGSYVAPIAGTPFTLVAYGVHSDSDVAAVGGIDVIGSGDIAGIRGIYSFQSSDTIFHTLTFGADYKSFKEDLILGEDTAATPIDYIPITLQYAFAQREATFDIDANVALNFGLRGLDATEREFQLKRSEASASWAYLRGDVSVQQRLPHDIVGLVRLSGQISGQPLISNEQFSIGGYESVRGYYESQELGDDGVSFQAELRSPALIGGAAPSLDELRFFAFADGGFTRIHRPLPDADGNFKRSARLLSVGAGINARFMGHFNATGVIAVPLRDRDSTLTDFGSGDVRGQFRIWAEF